MVQAKLGDQTILIYINLGSIYFKYHGQQIEDSRQLSK